MANSNKKILKIYAYGTFFYGFIGVQDNLASYINSDIKNRGEIILQKKIEKIRNQVEEFKKEVEEIESNRKDDNTISQGSLQQYKEKMDKKCRDIQEKIEESLNEAEMLEWKGIEGLKLYKEARNREIKINKNIQEVKNLQNAIDNAIEKENRKSKRENKNKDIKNDDKTKKIKELSEEEKRKIDKKEIKKREEKIEGYKKEIKNLKEKINENLKKEEEINAQKEKESVVFDKKINKEKEIAKKNAQVLVNGNNKKISELEKNLERLKKEKVNNKNKRKIQKDIEEKKAEIAKLKKKNDDILLNNEKGYDEKIKKFNNNFSVKIEKIKALNVEIQKRIAELENLIDAIQREIDIISENGYEYFIKYSKKEKSSKGEEALDNATEEKNGEELPGEETGKKEEKFDFITKNKVFGIKNSSILIDSNFSVEHDLCDIKKWENFEKSFSIMASGDFYLNFNRANENKIYKKLKFSVDFYWMKDLDIVETFRKEAFEVQTLYEKGLIKKIEAQYNFYKNKNIKIGFKAGYRGLPYLNNKKYFGYKFGDTGLFVAFTTKVKKIKTSFEAGVDVNLRSAAPSLRNVFGIKWKKSISPVILTKTKLKYFDLNGYLSIFSFPTRKISASKILEKLIIRTDFKIKKIKYLEDTLVKIYFGNRFIISSLNDEVIKKKIKDEELYIPEIKAYFPIVGISTTYKICLDKMNIFKILGFEKFKCKLNLIVEYIISAKEDAELNKDNYNQFQGKLDLNIGILKLKESRFKKLGKLQVNVFNFALERTSVNIFYNGKGFFNKYIFDVLVLKYNILKGLSLSLHLLNFEMRYELKVKFLIGNMNNWHDPKNIVMPIPINQQETPQNDMGGQYAPAPMELPMQMKEEPGFNFYWLPSLEIKFDVAKYLVAKKKK